jgi:ketosteroid isomerase-like protein
MGATEDAASRRPARSGDTRLRREPSPKAENAELVRRIFDAFARKQGFALRGLFADDATWVVPGDGVMAGTFHGRDQIFRFLARLPKETDGTYGSRLIDVLASEDRAAALYRAFGSRKGRTLDIDQVLLFRIEDGRVVHVLALPCDPAAFEEFWAT